MNWSDEWALIRSAALAHGIDPYFVAAIRKAENGGPGREFGVLSVKAPTYRDQLEECCTTIRRRMAEHQPTISMRIMTNGHGRICLPDAWIAWFGSRWAPVGAPNDPHRLNENWAHNVMILYHQGMDTLSA